MKKFSIALIASLLLASSLFAQKPTVTGAVNMQRLLAGYTEYQTALEKYRGAIAPAEEELESVQQKLQEMQEKGKELEAKKDNPALSDEAKAEAEAEYNQLASQFQLMGKQFQAFQTQTQQRRNKSRQQFLLPLELKARETVATVAKDKAVDFVVRLLRSRSSKMRRPHSTYSVAQYSMQRRIWILRMRSLRFSTPANKVPSIYFSETLFSPRTGFLFYPIHHGICIHD